MTVYFGTEKRIYYWKPSECIAEIDNPTWNLYREGVEGVDWKIENGEFVKITGENEMLAKLSKEELILMYTVNLNETDYMITKFYEGALSDGEYAKVKAQREAWRKEINRLEKE